MSVESDLEQHYQEEERTQKEWEQDAQRKADIYHGEIAATAALMLDGDVFNDADGKEYYLDFESLPNQAGYSETLKAVLQDIAAGIQRDAAKKLKGIMWKECVQEAAICLGYDNDALQDILDAVEHCKV